VKVGHVPQHREDAPNRDVHSKFSEMSRRGDLQLRVYMFEEVRQMLGKVQVGGLGHSLGHKFLDVVSS